MTGAEFIVDESIISIVMLLMFYKNIFASSHFPRAYGGVSVNCNRVIACICIIATAICVSPYICVYDAYALSNTDYERYKVSSTDFAKADAELNRLWRTLKHKLPAWEYEQLLQEQRTWLNKGYDAEAGMYLIGMPAAEAYALAVNSRVEHLKRRFSSILRDSGEIPDTPSSPNTLPAASRRADVSGASSNEDANPTSRPSSPLTIPSQHGDQRSGGAAQLQQQQANDTISVTAEGSGTTRYEALRMAWNEAVRKGVGMYLSSKTQVIDDKIIEEIASYSRGQIDSFNIISENRNQHDWNVSINAKIKKDIIEEFTASRKEHQIGLGDNDVAKLQVEQDKKASQSKLLDMNKELFDFSKLLYYKSSLEKLKIKGETKYFVKHIVMIDIEKYDMAIKNIVGVMNKITTDATRFRHDNSYKIGRDTLYKILMTKSVDMYDNKLIHYAGHCEQDSFTKYLSDSITYPGAPPRAINDEIYHIKYDRKVYGFKHVLPITLDKFYTTFFVLSDNVDVAKYINVYHIEFYYKFDNEIVDITKEIRMVPAWNVSHFFGLNNLKPNYLRGRIIPMISTDAKFYGWQLLPFLLYWQEVRLNDPSQLKNMSAGYELRKIN